MWPRREGRDANFDLVFSMLQRVSATSPFQVSEPQRVYADAAASYVGVPTRDSVDLLLSGWLASAQFSEHDSAALPNQSNWYDIHVFAYHDQAMGAASCYQEANFVGDARVDETFPYDAVVHIDFLSGETGSLSITTVTAVHGSNLITGRIYGDHGMSDHGLSMIRSMIMEIGDIR